MDAAAELAQIKRERDACKARSEKLENDNADLGRQLKLLGIDCDDPERQLDWFRRQLFGSKSEKRVEIPPGQLTFRDRLGLENPNKPEEKGEEEFDCVKRKKKCGRKSFEGAADESGPDIPVETIAIDNPEAAGIPESERGPVGEKVARRLAQTACAFRIIRYVSRSWKRRDAGEPIAAAPTLCGRETPELDAKCFFSDIEIAVLADFAKERGIRGPENLGFAVDLVAFMGGHLQRKHDRLPGNEVVWRGYLSLADSSAAGERTRRLGADSEMRKLLRTD